MKMSIEEKKSLYAFGCPDRRATIGRLCKLAAIAPELKAERHFYTLAFKLLAEGTEDWYRCFFYNLRREMEGYFNAQRTMHRAEVSTCDTEDNYDKAD